MQIQQAIDAAAAKGYSVTIITLHPPDGYDEGTIEDAYAAAPPSGTASSDVPTATTQDSTLMKRVAEAEKQLHAASAQIADLQQQLAKAAGGDSAALIAQANSKIAELEQALATVTTAPTAAAPANGNGNGDAGAALASFESYPANVLGLSEKAQKGINKCDCISVGDVRAAFLSGKLSDKGKGNGSLSRLEIIEVANKLLGQVPSAAPPPPTPGSAPGGGAARADVPTGLNPPSWEKLLTSAYKKEQAAHLERQKIEQALQAIAGIKTAQVTPDTQQQLAVWENAKVSADAMLAMYEGQVATLLYVNGLPYDLKQVRSVNGALKTAGLHHLVNETPQPEGVPAGAGA